MSKDVITARIAPNLKAERAYHDGNPLNKKKGSKSVLLQVDPGAAGAKAGFPGRYVFVPEELAQEKVKAHQAVYVKPSDPDYVNGVKLALGRSDGFKPGEVIQIGGKAFAASDIGLFDAESAITAAIEAAKKAEDDPEVLSAMLKDPASFDGKQQQNPFGH